MKSQILLLQVQIGMLLLQGPGIDDPGMPGGDPDLPELPETPLDSGVYFLIVIALVYGVWRIRRLNAQEADGL